MTTSAHFLRDQRPAAPRRAALARRRTQTERLLANADEAERAPPSIDLGPLSDEERNRLLFG